ncbi:hypothetical protein STANM309S_02791 [Streptomyces tanashiensis]
MNRRTKIVAVAAAILLTLGAGGVAVASGTTPPPLRPPSRRPAAPTGTAKLYMPAGDDITFSFDAHLADADPTIDRPTGGGRARGGAGTTAGTAHTAAAGGCLAGEPEEKRRSGESTSGLGALHEGLARDAFQDALEVAHVRGEDLDDGVRVTGDGRRGHHLGVPLQTPPDVVRRGVVAAVDLDEPLGLPAERRRVHPYGEAGDGTLGTEPVHAPLHGGRGESDERADVGVAAAGVFREGVDDAFVEVVESHYGWITSVRMPGGSGECRTGSRTRARRPSIHRSTARWRRRGRTCCTRRSPGRGSGRPVRGPP